MEVEVKRVDFGSLKALVSVKLEVPGIEIRGFKVIEQDGRDPWVSVPSREINREGQKEYYNIVRFADDDAKKKFNEEVLEAYNKQVEADTRAVAAGDD
jgi:DNA-binding cell septation regulator SpoVG